MTRQFTIEPLANANFPKNSSVNKDLQEEYQDFLSRTNTREIAENYNPYPEHFGQNPVLYFRVIFTSHVSEESLGKALARVGYALTDYRTLTVIPIKELEDSRNNHPDNPEKLNNVLKSKSKKLGRILKDHETVYNDAVKNLEYDPQKPDEYGQKHNEALKTIKDQNPYFFIPVHVKSQYDAAIQDVTRRSLVIAISKNPFHIATMSTGRAWEATSNTNNCMLMDEQKGWRLAQSFPHLLRHNALIAYAIDENDLAIKSPLNRILLYPFVDKESGTTLLKRGQVIQGLGCEKSKGLLGDIVSSLVENHFNKGVTGYFTPIPEIKYHNTSLQNPMRFPEPNVEMTLWMKNLESLYGGRTQ